MQKFNVVSIVQALPKCVQAQILKIGFLQRRETYLTDMPNMLPMLNESGVFSYKFSLYISANPALANLKSLFIQMDGGVQLHALYLPPTNSKLICAFHGIKGNWFDNPHSIHPEEFDEGYNPRYRMELLAEFARDGFGFLAFTLPGFHPSQGKPSEENFNLACDAFVKHTINTAKAANIKAGNIIVCGESLGGAVAAIFAKKLTEQNFAPSVLSMITTFDSLIGMTHNKFEDFTYDELRGILKEQMDTTRIFEHLNPKETYLHIVATEDDNIIPFENTSILLDAAKSARNGEFNILYHLVPGRHTNWDKSTVLGSKKTAHSAHERNISIATHQSVADIETILKSK